MSDTSTIVPMLTSFILELFKQYGILVGILAIFGLFAIVSAIFSQSARVLKNLFYIFIAVPLIIFLGLVNKANRKARLQELGDIRAYITANPDKKKKLIYYILLTIFFTFILVFVWTFVSGIVHSALAFNEVTKIILNKTNFTASNLTA